MVKRVIFILILVSGPTWGGEQPVVVTGALGGGLFLPTGDDADVASISPSIELNGAVAIGRNWGLESEFIYVPIRLDDSNLAALDQRKSSQMTVLAGLRLKPGPRGPGRPIVVALRAGFARVATVATTAAPQGGWIGGTLDRIENPAVSLPSTRTTDAALALSPRISVAFPLSGMGAVELGLSPVFIFNRGNVSTQIHLGLRFALTAHATL